MPAAVVPDAAAAAAVASGGVAAVAGAAAGGAVVVGGAFALFALLRRRGAKRRAALKAAAAAAPAAAGTPGAALRDKISTKGPAPVSYLGLGIGSFSAAGGAAAAAAGGGDDAVSFSPASTRLRTLVDLDSGYDDAVAAAAAGPKSAPTGFNPLAQKAVSSRAQQQQQQRAPSLRTPVLADAAPRSLSRSGSTFDADALKEAGAAGGGRVAAVTDEKGRRAFPVAAVATGGRSPASAEGNAALPDGWEAFASEKGTYYHCSSTGETTWTRP